MGQSDEQEYMKMIERSQIVRYNVECECVCVCLCVYVRVSVCGRCGERERDVERGRKGVEGGRVKLDRLVGKLRDERRES